MKFVQCDERHSLEIGEIFNEAIANSTAVYDYEARSKETIDAWITSKKQTGYPIVGLQSEAGVLVGFATFGQFRPWAAYQYTVEHSVYVHRDYRGQGLGRKILENVLDLAASMGYHMMIGGIDSQNIVSANLHKRLGFTKCGEIREAGFKFGRWLDLHFYQRLLRTDR